MENIAKTDFYELLSISITATEKEVKSAYRKKALTCHPDKNPDNPQAAELFQQLTQALDVLSDEKARADYDKVLRAKKQAQVRNRELDSKRKKFKEDLEAKERAAATKIQGKKTKTQQLQEEIERLRKETVRLLEQDREQKLQKIRAERDKINAESEEKSDSQNLPKLKVKWKVRKGSDDPGYSESDLHKIFEKHGRISCLMISKVKRGTAIVEFSTAEAARSAVSSQYEDLDTPLKVSWLGSPPTETKFPARERSDIPPQSEKPQTTDNTGSMNFEDYESIVLMKLREAGEKQRLAKQKMQSDGVSLSETESSSSSQCWDNPPLKGTARKVNWRDFESLTARQIRQADERQRLIKQMMEEDGNETAQQDRTKSSFEQSSNGPPCERSPSPEEDRTPIFPIFSLSADER